jgi:hypothetical protein
VEVVEPSRNHGRMHNEKRADPSRFRVDRDDHASARRAASSEPGRTDLGTGCTSDLRPKDQGAQVDRSLDLGAERVDIGQPDDATWVVMADPEENEFCVRAARPPEAD